MGGERWALRTWLGIFGLDFICTAASLGLAKRSLAIDDIGSVLFPRK